MNLGEKFYLQNFTEWIENFIPEFSVDIRKLDIPSGLSGVKSISTLGESIMGIRVFVIETAKDPSGRKIGLAKESFNLIKNYGTPNAIIAYYSEESSKWRLSLLTSTAEWSEGKIITKLSNPKRQSYVLGPQSKVNTPTRFLIKKDSVSDLSDLKNRFSLEVVNKEFYKEISESFVKLVGGSLGTGKNQKKYDALLKLPSIVDHSQINLEFTVRLIGRIIFCWFLREKKSESGLALMPKELLSTNAIQEHKDYYHNILEPIFFEILNKPEKSRREEFEKKPFSSVPYLNGGLFSPQEDDFYKRTNSDLQSQFHNILIIPDSWINDFFEILETYNFTIDENTSYDEEISIDPEMLGRIFENLLAEINPETGESARKSTGSYYTPRVIVDYMVDESLLLYLKQKTGIEESKLRAIISYDLTDDTQYPLNDTEKQKAIDALEKIKILDPACGSGAFPIGALQKMVFILQQIDPDGQLWFKKQIQHTSPEIRRVLEREFTHKNFDYIRKLGVIRENIYGIDIQPIATEISRLRCFLTLVVDERIDDSLENRGIEPLPNLDFKFVTANSLIGLPATGKQVQFGLFEDSEGISELKEIRDLFFNASGSEREMLKLQFVQSQNKMFQRLISEGRRGHADLTTKLTSWDPFNHKASSWFDPEWMFGIKEGFDVVIANPPYISHDKIEGKEHLKSQYQSFQAFADIYCYFIELAINIQSSQGLLCYITSNSYLRADYGHPLRKLLINQDNIHRIINIEDYQVFDSAIVNTAILIGSKKETAQKEIVASVVNSSFKGSDDFRKFIEEHHYHYQQDDFDDDSWTLISTEELAVKRKIENKHRTLERHHTKIRLGIATGANEAFIVDETKKLELVSKDNKSSEIIKPILRGKDINRYGYEFSNLYVLLTKNGIDVKNHYPAIYDYLDSFGPKFKSRGAQGQNWWNLRACAFFDDFKKEKIVWIELNDRGRFAFVSDEIYLINSAYFLLPPNSTSAKYLLGILNSNTIRFYMNTIAETSGMGTLRWINNYVKKFPIPEARLEQVAKIESLVDKAIVLANKQSKADVSSKRELEKIEKEIDHMVYELYGLTDEEIKIVEGEANIS